MDNLLDKETKNFIKFASIPMILVGVCFNSLAFGIFSRRRFGKHKIAYYTKINLISHCFCLLIYLAYNVFLVRDVELRLTSDLMCKLFQLMFRSSMQLTSWIEILITYDRNNSIRWTSPFKINNKRKFLKLTLYCACVVLLINSPNLGFQLLSSHRNVHKSELYEAYNLNETLLDRYCLARPELIVFRDILFKIFGIYMPLFIMIYMNVKLFKDLLVSSNSSPWAINLNQNGTTARKCIDKRRVFKREVNYGLTIFALNTLFVLTYLPFAIIIIIITVSYFNSPVKFDRTNVKNFYLMYVMNMFVLSFYYSSTFFVNLLLNRYFAIEFGLFLRGLNVFNKRRKSIINATNRRTLASDGTTINEQTSNVIRYLNRSNVQFF